MSNSGIRSIAINTAYLSSARLITSISRAIYAVLLAKFLGSELYGLFNYGVSWYVLLVPVSVLGLDGILIHEIGRDRKQAEHLVGLTLSMRTVSTLIISIFSFLFACFFEPDPLSRQLLFIFSVALFGRGLSLWSNSVFKAYEASNYVFLLEVVFRLLDVLLGVVLLFSGYGVIEIALVHAGSWLLQGMAGIVVLKLHLLNVKMIWDLQASLYYAKKGIPFLIGGFVFGWLLQGPIVMYRHFEGLGVELGQLALALQALFIIGAIVGEVGGAALPVLARSVDRADGKTERYVDIIFRVGAVMSGVLSITATAISPWLVGLLFGDNYLVVAKLLPWTLILVAPYFWIPSFTSLIVAYDRYKIIMINYAVGALVFTLAFLLLVSTFDLLGVVLSLGLGLIATVACHLFEMQKQQNFSMGFIRTVSRLVAVVLIGLLITNYALQFGQWLALGFGLTSFFLMLLVFNIIRLDDLKKTTSIILSIVKR